MSIPASLDKVLTVPPTSEKVYDAWWLDEFRAVTIGPGTAFQTTSIHVMMRKCLKDADGLYEFAPEPPVMFSVQDVFALAATDEVVGAALQGLLAAVTKIGTDQGLL